MADDGPIAFDPADLFGDDAEAGEDFTRSVEDFFKAEEAEAEPVEPDRGRMTEEEWRASPQYAEFRQRVIARHLLKKTGGAAVQAPTLPAIRQPADAGTKAPPAGDRPDAEERRRELLEKYKAAKAATIAQRAKAMEQSRDRPGAVPSLPPLRPFSALPSSPLPLPPLPSLAPRDLGPKAATPPGMGLDLAKAKQVAAMFEETRIEMLQHVGVALGKKAAQDMMQRTLAKVAKAHLDFYARAAVDENHALRPDGRLDEDKLARAIYAVPEDGRAAVVRGTLFELLELRFIACELMLGQASKDKIVAGTLRTLKTLFAKKAYPADLVRWYFDAVVPASGLEDGHA